MTMPLEKATKILNTYRDNNYVANKTLKQLGYSSMTANKEGGKVIDRAYKAVAREVVASDNPKSTALLFTGLSPEAVRNEYLKVITQDRDYTNKLKALVPLLKELGVVFQDDQTTQRPIVQMTMVKNDRIEKMGGGDDEGVSSVSSDESSIIQEQNDTFPQETSNEEDISNSNGIEESPTGPEVSPTSEVPNIIQEDSSAFTREGDTSSFTVKESKVKKDLNLDKVQDTLINSLDE